ncbi:hypothetical protein C8Q74DRAFT_708453 [Fomes fomentarius]|nr:hypothetical protein C8Q74DRAFT_708453 [Fomes fomentarius]
MRDLSIPPWTILRESSSSSAAPSEPEDELQEQSFQERMAPPSRTLPQPVAGPSTSRATYGGRGITGNSTLGPQAFSSAPRPPIPTTFSSNPRRPLSSSDDEATDRPKKKKKRKIIDPEKGAAFANTKVSLSGTPSGSATRPPPSQLKLPSTARPRGLNHLRRVTLDIGSLDQMEERNSLRAGNQDINKQRTETFLPPTSAPIGQLVKKYKTQVESASSSEQGSSSSNGTIGVNDRRSKSSSSHRASPNSATASPSRPASPKPPPAADVIVLDEDDDAPLRPPIQRRVSAPAVPLSREVIEILDSDEEPAPPPAKIPAKPPHTQAQKRALPRRSTFRKPPSLPSSVRRMGSSQSWIQMMAKKYRLRHHVKNAQKRSPYLQPQYPIALDLRLPLC